MADITRVLKDKSLRGEKGGEVAKLFSKHIKLADHVTYLKQTKVGAAVGTPGRIGKLLCESGELNENCCQISQRELASRCIDNFCSLAYHS